MESIKNRVAIIGMGCTKFGENWDKSTKDMIVEAAYEAFEDAGISPKDIQAAWVGTEWSGETGQTIGEPLKLGYIPISRVENQCATGSDALRNAAYAVAAGIYDMVLVVGVEKLKDSGWSGLPLDKMNSDNTYRERTATAPGNFALMATRYFSKYGLGPEEGKRLLAEIAVKNHHNGTLAPKAHFQRELTVEQVLNAPIVSWPLGLFDCCGVSDGAAAAIITRGDIAKKFRSDPIYIKALQICVGPREGFINPAYDYSHVEETRRAGKAAYAEAGIKDPHEINTAEVHDCFTITELTIYEDLGWSLPGQAKKDIEAGTFILGGKLPVNTDGGLKCFGHPVGASGLRMLYEEYKQLQGKAGQRQVENPKLALTHNMGGPPGGAVVSVVIVGNEK
jgi:acetyl-CoA C-acetyltransferase